MRLISSFLVNAFLCVAVTGCGGPSRPDMAPVSGVVTYKGNPVEGAEVVFRTDTAPRAAFGTTDASGRYSLTTFENEDGAVPGDHTITITKTTAAAGAMSVEIDFSSADADPSAAYAAGGMGEDSGNSKVDTQLPIKYASPETTDLKRTVVLGETNEFNFELTDE